MENITIQQIADTYFGYFEQITKVDNRNYVVVKDLDNKEVHSLYDSVFGSADRDQTTISIIHSCLSTISECSDLANVELNLVVTHLDLMNWLSDNYDRAEQLGDIVNSNYSSINCYKFDLFDIMQQAYIAEAYEILYSVLSHLEDIYLSAVDEEITE